MGWGGAAGAATAVLERSDLAGMVSSGSGAKLRSSSSDMQGKPARPEFPLAWHGSGAAS